MAASKKPKPLSAPRTICFTSGDTIRYAETSAGWQVRGKNWFSSRFYATKEIAQWHFSHNEGVPPTFQNPFDEIKVGDVVVPKFRESADNVADAEKLGDTISEEALQVLEK